MRFLLSGLALSLAMSGLAQAGSSLPMRLGDAARPLAYKLDLKIDPNQPRHSGQVEIQLELAAAMKELRLHAKELRIAKVEYRPEGGGKARAGKAVKADEDSAWLRFPQGLPAGRGTLRLTFTGVTSEQETLGLFRQREGGDWYAITQFEDLGARMAFPSFDEPGWKVPWTLSLTVPEKQVAVANEPVESEAPAGKGWKKIAFKTTPPLPSYLLAFAVGPFSVKEGGSVGATPLRYFTPRGRADEASFAASATPAVVQELERWFGMPHPFRKLDSLVIPLTENFGAMENAGLITYAGNLILGKPGNETLNLQRSYVSIAAHEIAHQWFGNHVTMAWWDDLWLNESFASWMGDKITARVRPGWRWELNTQGERRKAMGGDRLPTARRVHQPVRTNEDLGTAFDEITYSKGQSVLSMFESWLGEERMQAGVRRYIQRHAGSSATGEQFVRAISDGDKELQQAFTTFIDQAGIPVVSFELQCDEARAPQLLLSQSRYRPLGVKSMPDTRWMIPVVLRSPAGVTRHLLKSQSEAVQLPDASCPAWLQPNADGKGYYRSRLETALLQPQQYNAGELLAMMDDQFALTQSGDLKLSEMLPLLRTLAADPRRELKEFALETLAAIDPLFGADQRAGYAALLQSLYGPLARELGWRPDAKDDEDRRLLRQSLLPLMADSGRDAVLREQALLYARSWVAAAARDGKPHEELLDPGLRSGVLRSAALGGDANLFDAMLGLARKTPERQLREQLLAALGYFGDAVLATRARELALDAQLDIREVLGPVIGRQTRDPQLNAAALDFLVQNDAAIRKRITKVAAASLPEVAGGGCSLERVQRLQQQFGPAAAQLDAGPAVLAKTLSRIELCSAYREAQASDLPRLLESARQR
ncbi:M1 family metallopeptidase [Pelomonas sp. SE-A7]|uniref:M1 family metallopeptidase n=1 Tax=Pelomonas sp. SE-A7 TaxID=3054953 RepID=UPI00259CFF40|nr:M1 family metallopeptidase [Pelomonas sp. SE-A7]MDM4767214.1 M1 family aminopeptidase [Pelomonas sp. SE-A7]